MVYGTIAYVFVFGLFCLSLVSFFFFCYHYLFCSYFYVFPIEVALARFYLYGKGSLVIVLMNTNNEKIANL